MKALTTWNLLMKELHTLEHETESAPPRRTRKKYSSEEKIRFE